MQEYFKPYDERAREVGYTPVEAIMLETPVLGLLDGDRLIALGFEADTHAIEAAIAIRENDTQRLWEQAREEAREGVEA